MKNDDIQVHIQLELKKTSYIKDLLENIIKQNTSFDVENILLKIYNYNKSWFLFHLFIH